MKRTVGIIGGSGMVGRALSLLLRQEGFDVIIFSRSGGTDKFLFDYQNGLVDLFALKKCQILVNLAGANVGAHRWTASYKNEIYDSRVKLTEFLANVLEDQGLHPEFYLGASATGYYPDGKVEAQNENALAGVDFLSKVCLDWETAHHLVGKNCDREVVFRTGVVMDKDGGFLPKIIPVVKWGLAAPLGTGKQLMPWIAQADLIAMMLFVINNPKLRGVFNAVAPEALSNKACMEALCQKLGKKLWLPPIPSFLIKLLFGEFSQELLGSRNVIPSRMQEAGYEWIHPYFSKLTVK